ncbi:MAG: aldo/keto reductase [Hyphomicrobium sp.]
MGMFVLGTVQLGLPYGISNRNGKPTKEQAFAVLDAAYSHGVSCLDTARSYGESEELIGAWQKSRKAVIEVVTKIPPLAGSGAERAEKVLSESLKRLGTARVQGLLLHRASDLGGAGMDRWIDGCLESGRIGDFGVSIYDADELPDEFRIRMVQFPASVLNQTCARSTAIRNFRLSGRTLFVRSVLAQGLMVMPEDAIPAGLAAVRPFIARLKQIARQSDVSVLALAIASARRLAPGGDIVLGAETPSQVEGLVEAWMCEVPDAVVDACLDAGRDVPADLVDPRRW